MKTLIAIPCMDTVNTLFFKSFLNLRVSCPTEVSVTISSLVYDARNILAKKAIDGGFDRILWIDSDMVFDSDLADRLHFWLDQGYQCVSGLYFKRKLPIMPVVYKDLYIKDGVSVADAYGDYPQDTLFEIKAMGLGGVMMTVDLLKRVGEKFGLPFSPIMGFGEDLSFCKRVEELGEKMYCDSSIKLGHIGSIEVNEDIYRSGMLMPTI